MKTKTILFIVIGIIFLATFFFKVIPIPVDTHVGDQIVQTPYWTSGLYQLGVGSISFLFYSLMFGTLTLGNYFMEYE